MLARRTASKNTSVFFFLFSSETVVSSCNARATGHYRAHRRSEQRRRVSTHSARCDSQTRAGPPTRPPKASAPVKYWRIGALASLGEYLRIGEYWRVVENWSIGELWRIGILEYWQGTAYGLSLPAGPVGLGTSVPDALCFKLFGCPQRPHVERIPNISKTIKCNIMAAVRLIGSLYI